MYRKIVFIPKIEKLNFIQLCCIIFIYLFYLFSEFFDE